MSKTQKSAARTARPNNRPQQAAPVVKLVSGPISPAEAASSAARAKAAFERGIDVENLAKIGAVIQCKAMNGDLQAARMLMDYFGLTNSAPESEERHQQGNVVQVNIETDDRPRKVRLTQVDGN